LAAGRRLGYHCFIQLYVGRGNRRVAVAWQQGRNHREGIARFYSERFSAFDPDIIFRGIGADIYPERTRRFLHPKFYRRQTTWWAFKQANIFEGNFSDWLTEKAETCWYLPEFRELRKKSPLYPLYDRELDGTGISWEPEDFIFAESPSTIKRLNAQGELKKISNW
jgi:hypothetical protein